MGITRRRAIACGMAVVMGALLAGVWGLGHTARPAAAAVDPAELLAQLTEASNAGDVEAVLEFYADDAVVGGTGLCGQSDCVGKDAIRAMAEYHAAINIQITIISAEVSGNTVTGTIAAETDEISAAGVDQVIIPFTLTVQDDKIAEYRTEWDMSEPGTAALFAYIGENYRVLGLGPGRDADQTPILVELFDFGGQATVSIHMTTPAPAGVAQPANIHEGTCANLGDVAFSLHPVRGGKSGTPQLEISLSELVAGEYAINIQESEDEPDVYVACGDVSGAMELAPPAEEPVPAPEEAPPVIAPAPAPAEVAAPVTGSGGLLGEEGSRRATWWYALVAGGALLLLGGLARVSKVRSRR